MDIRLKGSQLPPPKLLDHPLSNAVRHQPGFETIQTFYPGMGVFSSFKKTPEEDLWFDHKYRLIDLSGWAQTKTSGPVSLRIERNGPESGVEVQDISGFRKLTHLLDPIRWVQGKYTLPKDAHLPWHQESWESTWTKLQDPMNQAYVEALATYAFSRIREAGLSPHFHLFFGSMCAKADEYAYNITDSYMSYRHARWFWTAQEKQVFKLFFDESIPQEVKAAILNIPDELEDSSDESESDTSEEELNGLECDITDAKSIHSAGGSAFESASESSEEEEETSEDHSDDEDDLEIFAEIKKFPVMMIFTEASKGTMDDLLDDYEEVGAEPGTKNWDTIWSAWIFQILAALSAGQNLFGFTHNDLHSNNIVWTPTEIKFLHYKMRDGQHFKVPTFGKLFRVIDFGRSIFRINDLLFFSDDFRKGNDAAEQFNFGEIYDSSEPEVYPNPSFDLCRFTVSVFESLFPESPPIPKAKKILSKEPDLIVYETESELYNVLWSWLLCDDGHNVLIDPDGSERYPNFDLYKVITQEVHTAVPCEQFAKAPFKQFATDAKECVNTTVYPLFC
jgi:hypothetical protein